MELDQNGDCAPLGDGASPVQPSCTPGHQESGIGGQGAHQVEGDPDQRVSDRGIQSLTPINGQDTEAGGQSTLIPPGDMGQQGAQVGGNWPGGSILRRDGTVLHTVGIRRAVAERRTALTAERTRLQGGVNRGLPGIWEVALLCMWAPTSSTG